MKKLLLAALLCVGAMGAASAATAIPGGEEARGGADPFGVTVYVRGGWNGWGVTDPMSYDAGSDTYSAIISLTAGSYEFKVASDDWSTVDLGNIDGAPPINSFPTTINVGNTPGGGNIGIEIAASGLYSFTLDVSGHNGVDNLGPYALTVAQVVPLPAAAWLFLSALAGLGFLRRR